MPFSRTKTLLRSLASVVVAASLVVAPIAVTGAAAAGQVGVVGISEDATPQANSPEYWEARYAAHKADCYKAEGSTSHGKLTDGDKTVTLNPFQDSWPGDHWEVLVVKAGNTNYVNVHPQAGVAYASPMNNGGQQADVSHWIVCKGTTPETAPTKITPTLDWTLPSCAAAGVITKSSNVEWVSKLNADGTTTWTAKALAGTVFADGVKSEWVVPNLDKLTTAIESCRPPQPEPEVTSKESFDYDCQSKSVTVTTTTTTTLFKWNGTDWAKDEPTVQLLSSERPMSAAEKKDCPLPDTQIEYGSWTDGEWNCGDTQVTQTREITSTVYEYDAEGSPIAKSSVSREERTRDLTQAEIGECPLVPGDLFASCQGDVPYLGYDLTLPAGYVNDDETPVTITFVNPSGEHYVVENQPLVGSLLWPGAKATEPKMWPGWDLVDGTYVQTEGNFAWTRDDVTVRFAVNPAFETVIEYPEASALCANPPKQAISPEPPTDNPDPGTPGSETPGSETPDAGTPGSETPDSEGPLAATGGVVSPIVPLAGGAMLLMGLSAVAFVAYQRRRADHSS